MDHLQRTDNHCGWELVSTLVTAMYLAKCMRKKPTAINNYNTYAVVYVVNMRAVRFRQEQGTKM